MLTQCCVCHAIKNPDTGKWLPHEGIEFCSHGYCPECKAIAMQEIDAIRMRDMCDKRLAEINGD